MMQDPAPAVTVSDSRTKALTPLASFPAGCWNLAYSSSIVSKSTSHNLIPQNQPGHLAGALAAVVDGTTTSCWNAWSQASTACAAKAPLSLWLDRIGRIDQKRHGGVSDPSSCQDLTEP